jgi:hypothetical protein
MKLLHPIYLNVPMLVGFAAAIRDGVALESSVSRKAENAEKSKSDASVRAGLGKLLTPFIAGSIGGGLSSEASGGTQEILKESRRHTESSIAIQLYNALSGDEGLIFRPSKPEDLENVPNGALVELKGVAYKNAIDTIIDTIAAITIMTNFSVEQNSPKKGVVNPQVAQAERIRQILEQDRGRTPISNLVVECSSPSGMKAIVSLNRENLRDLTLSELQGNTVSVIGKVVRYIHKDNEVVSFENYGLAMLARAEFDALFQNLSKISFFKEKFDNLFVKGPAVQIFPLMIYV